MLQVQYEDLHNLSKSDLLEIGISSEEITIVADVLDNLTKK